MNQRTKKIIKITCILIAVLLVTTYVISSLTYKITPDVELRPKPINSIIFSFGEVFGFELAIRWYGLMIMGGVAITSLYGYFAFLKKTGLDADTTLGGVVGGVIFGIMGGRLYYVAFEPSVVTADFLTLNWFKQVFLPVTGGLAVHGAVIGATIFIIIYCYIKKVKFFETIEIVLPVFMLAQVVGRWGNFFNQEAFGPIVNGYQTSPLTNEQLASQRETLRHLLVPDFIINQMYLTNYSGLGPKITGYYHPTFLYEGVFNLIGAFGYIYARKRFKQIYIGDGISFYAIWYGIVRIFIESLRRDPLTFTIGGVTFKTAIVISILLIIGGITFLVLRRVYKFKLVSVKSFIYEGGSIWKDNRQVVTTDSDLPSQDYQDHQDQETPDLDNPNSDHDE